MFSNSKILIIRHLRVVPLQEVLLVTRKSFVNKTAVLRDMFKKASKSICTSTIVPPDPLSPTPKVKTAMKTPENIEEDPDASKPADEGDIQLKCSSD